MPMINTIRTKLEAALAPDTLEIVDESHLHRGHAGARPGGESHFRVRIVSKAFAGMGRLQRQRAVLDALSEEMTGPIHALSITARTPDEI